MVAIEGPVDAHTACKLMRVPLSSKLTAMNVFYIALEPKRRSSKVWGKFLIFLFHKNTVKAYSSLNARYHLELLLHRNWTWISVTENKKWIIKLQNIKP